MRSGDIQKPASDFCAKPLLISPGVNFSEDEPIASMPLFDGHHGNGHNARRIERQSGDGELGCGPDGDCSGKIRILEFGEKLVYVSRQLLAATESSFNPKHFFARDSCVKPDGDRGGLS